MSGRRRDGSIFPMELSVGQTASGARPLFTAFIRDLSARQKTEARLESLQSELIQVSRTRAMGTMATTLAHNLKQPPPAGTTIVASCRNMLGKFDATAVPGVLAAVEITPTEAHETGDIEPKQPN